MGEYVSASIEIGGHLETVAEAEILIEALLRQVITFNETDDKITCTENGQTALRTVIELGKVFRGYDHQVNYGNFDEIDAIAPDLPKLWFSTSYGAGGDFSSGIKTFIEGEEYRCTTADGEPVVSLDELELAVNGNDLDTIAYETIRIVTRTKREAGKGLPPLTASPAVCAWLKIFGDKAA
jgi:hypothetical protein